MINNKTIFGKTTHPSSVRVASTFPPYYGGKAIFVKLSNILAVGRNNRFVFRRRNRSGFLFLQRGLKSRFAFIF